MAAPGRLELSTLRLTAACSTDWAKGQWKVATTYPPGVEAQVLSAWESLTSVFGMGTGGSSLLSSPPWYIRSLPGRNIMAVTDQCFPPYLGYFFFADFPPLRLNLAFLPQIHNWTASPCQLSFLVKRHVREIIDLSFQDTFRSVLLNFTLRSSPRPISIGQLNALPHLHLRPIYLIVFKGSYYLMIWDTLSWGQFHA